MKMSEQKNLGLIGHISLATDFIINTENMATLRANTSEMQSAKP